MTYPSRSGPNVRGPRSRFNVWRLSGTGILLLLLGLWWLLGTAGYVNFDWAYVGPLALIVVGASLVIRRALWGGCCYYYGSQTGDSGETPSLAKP